jgi:hypothetical protein
MIAPNLLDEKPLDLAAPNETDLSKGSQKRESRSAKGHNGLHKAPISPTERPFGGDR